MIQSVTVTNHRNESLVMELRSPEKSGLAIRNIGGLGPGSADINISDISTGDGGRFQSARMGTRNIVFLFRLFGFPDIETTRQKVYRYFPLKHEVKLRFVTDNRDAEIVGYVESNEPTIFSEAEEVGVSIICPFPYFRSSGGDGFVETTLYGIEPEFEFPFSNESLEEPMLIFSSIKVSDTAVVNYIGDANVGVIINLYIYSPCGNITLYNVTTRQTMTIDSAKIEKITGKALQERDEVIVNTVRGQKSVLLLRDGVYTNILNSIDKNTDWIYLVPGENVIAYTAVNGMENLQFTMKNQILYEGI